MTPSEKVAYLKGLAEGLGVDKTSKEGKLLDAVIDVLEDLAFDLDELGDVVSDMSDDLDDLNDEIDVIGDLLAGEFDEDDDWEDWDEDEDEDEEPVFYEVTCPECENTITVDEDVLFAGAIRCPNCDSILEFDLDNVDVITQEDEEDEEDQPF